MSEHTKEPWQAVGTVVFMGANEGGFDIRDCPSPEANARRIVVCVNACAGIPTEKLARIAHAIGARASELMARAEQRDELLATLEYLKLHRLWINSHAKAIIESAIVKVKK